MNIYAALSSGTFNAEGYNSSECGKRCFLDSSIVGGDPVKRMNCESQCNTAVMSLASAKAAASLAASQAKVDALEDAVVTVVDEVVKTKKIVEEETAGMSTPVMIMVLAGLGIVAVVGGIYIIKRK